MVGAAAAQQPTKAQENALRSACRKDFMAHCSGVKPTGSAALACLKQHAASLSTPCRTAVSAVGGGSAAEAAGATPASTPAKEQAAAAQPTKAQENALRSACRKDFMSHCSGVKPTGSAALSCLQQHSASLSKPCRTAVSAVGGDAASAGATSSAGSTPARAKSARSSFRLPALRCGSQCRRLRELLGN
jgi:hypothetical protein